MRCVVKPQLFRKISAVVYARAAWLEACGSFRGSARARKKAATRAAFGSLRKLCAAG